MAQQKWLKKIPASAPVSEAAQTGLQSRLQEVCKWFPLAADHADEDVEHVHQLRVSTRRATASLQLFASTVPKHTAAKVTKRLKKIRRAAGAARDLDVLAERIQRHAGERPDKTWQALLKHVAKQRAAAQPRLQQIYAKQAKKLQDLSDHLLDKVRWRGDSSFKKRHEPSFEQFAETQLREAVQTFLTAAPVIPEDVAQLHEIRIEVKRLRYTLELLAAAHPDPVREAVYPQVAQLQQRLGEVNDHCFEIDTYSQLSLEVQGKQIEKRLANLLDQEEEALEAARCEAIQWWTGQPGAELRQQLVQLAIGKPANIAQSGKCNERLA